MAHERSQSVRPDEGRPTVDRSVVAELVESFEDFPEALAEVFELFFRGTKERTEQARRAVAAADEGELKAAAHSLRGMCGILGAERLSALAAELERLAEAAQFGAARDHIDVIAEEARSVRSALDELASDGALESDGRRP